MNLQHLKTFVAVVETGSFSSAARAVGISQPAVTMQIKALETEVGATLLERRYRRVDLTEAGTTLLPIARTVLSELDGAREDIAALGDSVSGQLVIAASTTPGVYVVPRLLGEFVRAFPQVGVTLLVSDSAVVVDRVCSGEANVGITGALIRGVAADFEQLGTDELVAVAPLSSPLVGRKVTLAQLAEQPFVMRERGSGTRQMAETALRERGIDPDDLRVMVELGTGEAVLEAVEGGLGVAIASRMVARRALAMGSIALLDVDGLPAQRPFYAVTCRQPLTRAAQAFVAHLRAALEG
jgi:DNA-binding transcriptional LysR family regulator